MQNQQDDMSFNDISTYSYNVADMADEFKTLGQINEEKKE